MIEKMFKTLLMVHTHGIQVNKTSESFVRVKQ